MVPTRHIAVGHRSLYSTEDNAVLLGGQAVPELLRKRRSIGNISRRGVPSQAFTNYTRWVV